MRQSNPGYEAEGKEVSGHKHAWLQAQLKGLSPEMYRVEEVDPFHIRGKQYSWIRRFGEASVLVAR